MEADGNSFSESSVKEAEYVDPDDVTREEIRPLHIYSPWMKLKICYRLFTQQNKMQAPLSDIGKLVAYLADAAVVYARSFALAIWIKYLKRDLTLG